MKQKYTTLVIYNARINEIYLLSGYYKIRKKNDYILTTPFDAVCVEEWPDNDYMCFLTWLWFLPEEFEVLGEL